MCLVIEALKCVVWHDPIPLSTPVSVINELEPPFARLTILRIRFRVVSSENNRLPGYLSLHYECSPNQKF